LSSFFWGLDFIVALGLLEALGLSALVLKEETIC
jgi:hypothetical protein